MKLGPNTQVSACMSISKMLQTGSRGMALDSTFERDTRRRRDETTRELFLHFLGSPRNTLLIPALHTSTIAYRCQLEGKYPSLIAPFLGLFRLLLATKCIACTSTGISIGIVVIRVIVVFGYLVGITLQRRNLLLEDLDLPIPPIQDRLLPLRPLFDFWILVTSRQSSRLLFGTKGSPLLKR
jgi:hypothetical protein